MTDRASALYTQILLPFQKPLTVGRLITTVDMLMLVWGTCSSALLHNVERIYLRAAKIGLYTALLMLTWRPFKKYIRWQPLINAYKLKLTSLMYSVYYALATNCDFFHKPEPLHYHLPNYSYFIGRTSLSYRGPSVWNILPEPFKPAGSHASFKQKIKNDPALLDKLSFDKESYLSLKYGTNKNEDFYYF